MFSLKRFGGYSMYPFLRPGDILFCKKAASPEDIHLGDIVVLPGDGGRRTAHRVINVSPLRVKGDNLSRPDSFLSAEVVPGEIVTDVQRGKRVFSVRDGKQKIIAFLSRYNLTPGILKRRFISTPLKIVLRIFSGKEGLAKCSGSPGKHRQL